MTAESALRRALADLFAQADVSANIGNIRSEEWASVTFTGMRHELRLRLSDASGRGLIAALADREFDLPGHILIDIAATELDCEGGDRLFAIEALTVAAD
jgi:hypothetical protein